MQYGIRKSRGAYVEGPWTAPESHKQSQAEDSEERAAFQTTAARDIIISLELIGGDAVWGDQRKLSFPPAEPEPDRCLGAIGPQTAMSTEIQLRL
jgi:hypothetical protein